MSTFSAVATKAVEGIMAVNYAAQAYVSSLTVTFSINLADKLILRVRVVLNVVPALVPISKRLMIDQFKKTIRSTDKIELEIKKENNRLKEEKNKKTTDKKPKKDSTKIIGSTKMNKTRSDHRITPHKKITGKSKVKTTIKK